MLEDADQQKRPQRCHRDRAHHADGLVQGGACARISTATRVRALLAPAERCWSSIKFVISRTMFDKAFIAGEGGNRRRAKLEDVFAVRAEELIEGRPSWWLPIRPHWPRSAQAYRRS